MSRHLIPGRDPLHQVYVGWDPPLGTFFGQVYDTAKGHEDNLIHWVGASRPRELYEISSLIDALEKYAAIPRQMQAMLYLDRDLGR